MARRYARVQGDIWIDNDWRALSRDAQWAYMLLLSQPQINNCGVLPLVTKRWSGFAAETDLDDIWAALAELEEARFVVCDRDTEEVLIRTFVRHDRVEDQPNVLKAARRQYGEVQSTRIRDVLRAENPHLFAESEPLAEDLPKGLREPLAEDLREGVNARMPSALHPATPPPSPREDDAPSETNGRVGEEDLEHIGETLEELVDRLPAEVQPPFREALAKAAK